MLTCAQCSTDNSPNARFCSACGKPLAATAPREARKLVTALFCDVVHSTALTNALDAETIKRLLARHFDDSRGVIQHHGGEVEKFIGDAVMAVFGAPIAHEDDAVRAVRAAVEMREVAAGLSEELERDLGVTLRTRTGLATGEVIASASPDADTYVTGAAVNLAARLEQSAAEGEILLSSETFHLVRDAVSAEALPQLDLKGFEEPIHAYRLLDVQLGAPGHTRHLDSPLVDRVSEQVLLREMLARIRRGRRCQLFTIVGTPGIGKSRLKEEFLSECGTDVTVLHSQCLPYGDRITYWPVAQLVRQAGGFTERDERTDARAAIARLVADLDDGAMVAERIGQTIGLVPGAPPPEESFWGVRRLFESIARRGPLVVVIDDLHWAETTLLDLIEDVVARARDAPIMMLCLARPDLLEARPDWGGGAVNSLTILLEPLEDGETQALLRNLLGGGRLSPEIANEVIGVAAGIPLFVEEIVRRLIEDGLIVRSGDRWTSTAPISSLSLPATITMLLAARIDRLDQPERTVLDRASVVGKEFSVADVEALSPSGERRDSVLGALDALGRKEFVRHSGARSEKEETFSFRHMLIRDTAYEGIPKFERADLHERYADWLESRAGGRIEGSEEIIGHHLALAHAYRIEVGVPADQVEALRHRAGRLFAAAGSRATTRGDTPATVRLLGQAAAMLPKDDLARLRLLPALADGLFQQGESGRADALLEEMQSSAARLGNAGLEVRARLEALTWRVVTDPRSVEGDELRTVAEDAVKVTEASRDTPGLAVALEELSIVHRLVMEDAEAMLDASERSLELALGADPSAVGMIAGNIVAGLTDALIMGPTPFEVGLERLEELLVRFAGSRLTSGELRLRSALVLAGLERFPEADAWLEEASGVFEDLGQRRWVAEASLTGGLIASWSGDPSEAERRIRSAYDAFRSRGEVLDAALVAGELAFVLTDLGRWDDASTLVDSIRREMPDYALEPKVAWQRVSAKLRAHEGAFDEATALALDAVRSTDGTGFLLLNAGARMDLAHVLRHAGRTDEAVDALDGAIETFTAKGHQVGVRDATERRDALLGIQ